MGENKPAWLTGIEEFTARRAIDDAKLLLDHKRCQIVNEETIQVLMNDFGNSLKPQFQLFSSDPALFIAMLGAYSDGVLEAYDKLSSKGQ